MSLPAKPGTGRPVTVGPTGRGRQSTPSRADSKVFAAGGAATPDRLLSCMAGFYDDEAQARQALLHLRQALGLLMSQSVLLSPDDAGRLRFARLSGSWASDREAAGARSVSDSWVAGAVGACLAILLALALLRLGARQSDLWQVVMLLAALGLGGVLGAGLFALSVQPRPAHRFDDKVRRQLGLGGWALVAYRVPWPQQAGVVQLLRSTSQRWCAEAPHIRRL